MQRAGVVDQPDIYFTEEVEARTEQTTLGGTDRGKIACYHFLNDAPLIPFPGSTRCINAIWEVVLLGVLVLSQGSEFPSRRTNKTYK